MTGHPAATLTLAAEILGVTRDEFITEYVTPGKVLVREIGGARLVRLADLAEVNPGAYKKWAKE
ncbi:hypothetical protein C1Y63_10435 [Corynebacterium sp. 13CS0277]|uniref:hypothetical protein n=1 Tax=Corynebacterium sp. 13CS0277 TaxID=2071994 RepID=UPI000D03079C|nr:hypothetical protein [Corynebacterium sp. 13CS0277]PRQ10604.1 hypothetical protein C1Y63_10435 [Corynebacterium sp. 13CS0277]